MVKAMKYGITMKYSAEYLQDLEQDDLEGLLKTAQKKFFELREQKSIVGRIDKPHLFGKVKKDIARIMTVRL